MAGDNDKNLWSYGSYRLHPLEINADPPGVKFKVKDYLLMLAVAT